MSNLYNKYKYRRLYQIFHFNSNRSSTLADAGIMYTYIYIFHNIYLPFSLYTINIIFLYIVSELQRPWF